MQDGLIQSQGLALKLAHDGSLPREVSRRGLFQLSCPHQALPLRSPKLRLPLHPSCTAAATPTAPAQVRGLPNPPLSTHLPVQTPTRPGNTLSVCSRFGGLVDKMVEL